TTGILPSAYIVIFLILLDGSGSYSDAMLDKHRRPAAQHGGEPQAGRHGRGDAGQQAGYRGGRGGPRGAATGKRPGPHSAHGDTAPGQWWRYK
ncbi:MAG: hypothetical protein ACK56I_18380, partial [bacterium]